MKAGEPQAGQRVRVANGGPFNDPRFIGAEGVVDSVDPPDEETGIQFVYLKLDAAPDGVVLFFFPDELERIPPIEKEER